MTRPADNLSTRLVQQAARAIREWPEVRAGLILRLVFVRFAEDLGLLAPTGDSLIALLARLEHAPTVGKGRQFRAWPELAALLDRVLGGGAPGLHKTTQRMSDERLLCVLRAVCVVDDVVVAYRELPIEHLGAVHEAMLATAARRSAGAHYTPRELAERVVRTALAPVLAATEDRANNLDDIKICDPAMGAGAFLLESCRQLAEQLVRHTGEEPARARLRVAQRCVHGIDKDPVAVALARLSLWLLVGAAGLPLAAFDANLVRGDSLDGRCWSRAFPEVFNVDGDNPGFTVIVGNPPFMGGVRISGVTSPGYLKKITAAFPGAGGQADLVAYFFRQSYSKIRRGGTLGLLATNTISQGATRKASLQAIVREGGEIYAAERRVLWPGSASVVASAVWIFKGKYTGGCALDGVSQPRITAFLVPHGGSEDPARLVENAGRAFKGVEPYGDGFVFEAGNARANAPAVLERVLRDAHHHARIFKYLGGEELNRSPTQAASRSIIDFDEMSLAEAERWPELLKILRARVRPERATKAADVAAWPWWQYWRTRPELRRAMRSRTRVLALADTSKHLALAFVSTGQILNKTLVVLAFDAYAAFAVLQSRVHEVWARLFGSSMRSDLRYTAKDVFETFPFPGGWAQDAALERVGAAYHEARAGWMVRAGVGLTGFYNLLHDPAADAPEVAGLRRLHAEMDRAVLMAYGWNDLAGAACEFTTGAEVRLRWSQAVQDEVLARLLALNRQRAAPA